MEKIKKWFPFNYRKIQEQKGIMRTRGVQIFCFTSAGSTANLYRDWTLASQDNNIEFFPVETPGKGSHISSPPAASIDDLVTQFLDVFCEVAQSPFILYGHSFGAAVAFQVAYALQTKGLKLPKKIIVAGRHAPHMKDPSTFSSKSSDEEVIFEIKKMGGTPQEILNHPEMLKFAISQLRVDLIIHESLEYNGQKLNFPIEAHCGTIDEASKQIMEHWREVTNDSFTIKEFEGDHYFIKKNNYLQQLINTISIDSQLN